MTKRKFWVLWTYSTNYIDKPQVVEADGPDETLDWVVGHFSDDFQRKATVYVFDRGPVLVRKPAKP